MSKKVPAIGLASVAQVQSGPLNLIASLGGWIGIIEAVLPGTAFAVLLAVSGQIAIAIVVGISLNIGFLARQIISRRPLTQAIAGILGLGLSAFLALRPGGSASDYFVPGLITNAAYATFLLLSVLLRWPVIGLVVSVLRGEGLAWRSSKQAVKKFSLVTLWWAAMFGFRLLVQIPLFITGQLGLLAGAKVALGVPLYALLLWLTWLALREVK